MKSPLDTIDTKEISDLKSYCTLRAGIAVKDKEKWYKRARVLQDVLDLTPPKRMIELNS